MYGACIIFYETVPSTLPELSNMRRLLEQPNEVIIIIIIIICHNASLL
jgi:hypothetical protein